MGRKLGGLCPFRGGELGPHLTQCGQGEAYLHAKFHLDPSNSLATIHQRYRQTDRQDRQRTDSIGRTVLQTVAQKRLRPLPKKGAEPPPKFSANFYCAQTAACIRMPLGMEVSLSPGDFVFDGDPAPSPKSVRIPSPILGPWPNGWMDQHGTLHGGGPWSKPHCASWGTQLPSSKKGTCPPSKFSAHFYCRQAAGCIKMPLGMEVGLSPGDFVLDGDPASPPLKCTFPQFSANVRCGQTSGWTKMALGTDRGRPRPRRLCVRWRPNYPQNKEHTHYHPVFGPCLLWPNSMDG